MILLWVFLFVGIGFVLLEGLFCKVYGNMGEFVRSLIVDLCCSVCGIVRGCVIRGFDLYQVFWVWVLYRVVCLGFLFFICLSIYLLGFYMNNKMILVISLLLLFLEEFIFYLEKIWESCFLINGGDMYYVLEEVLCEYLGVKYIVFFVNVILVFIIVLQVLWVIGEVIIMLYFFVVISYVLLWNGFKLIFVDIDQDFMNFDLLWIEVVIILQIIVILLVYCYGNFCDVEVIQWIVDIYYLKVIYDVVYVFVVCDVGGSVLCYGDLSIFSFYVIKVFNIFEGGVIICLDENIW